MKTFFSYLTFLLLFFSCNKTFSQKETNPISTSILSSNSFNQYSVENFFFDTDKKQYFSGDTIWYKLYVLEESTNKLNLLTKNVHIDLFFEKKLIDSQTLLVDNGIAYGKFKTNKNFNSGNYNFQINTNYNSNFKTPFSFPIEIISTIENEELSKKESIELVDLKTNKPILEFYPESNSLINGIHNKIIIKSNLKENTIIDFINTETSKIITSISTFADGSAIAFFKHNIGIDYKAKINFNNKEYLFNIPKASPLGFTLFKSRVPKNSTTKTFILKTNKETINTFDNKKVFIVLHKKGFIKSFAELTLNKSMLDYRLSFKKTDLFNGINAISIMSENNKTLVTRYFLNEESNNLNLGYNKISEDSIQVRLSSNVDKFANLSIAVHSENFNQNKSNIKSSIYFDNKFIEDSELNELFFKNQEKVDDYIQIISGQINPLPYKNVPTKEIIFKRENGFNLKGKITHNIDNVKDYKVMLTSKENNILLVKEIQTDKSFKFENLNLKKDSNYELALLNKKGKIINSGFYVYHQFTEFKNKSSINIDAFETKNLQKLNEEKEKKNIENLEFVSFEDAQILDEVTITRSKNEAKKETELNLKGQGIVGVGFSKVFSPKDSPYSNTNILQYLQSLPGVTLKYTSDKVPYLNNERYLKTFNNIGDAPLNIILDGSPIGTDVSLIDFRQAKEFEFIILNSRGAGFGSSYPKGVITLITLKGIDGKSIPQKNKNLNNFIADFGFSENFNRFESSLINYATESIKNNFKTIDWHPNINLFKNKTTTFNISTDNLKNLKLTINGVTDNGVLIFESFLLKN
jgi:hypothetical protein